MVPLDGLREFVDRRVDVNGTVEMFEVAEEFDVPTCVATLALEELSR